MKITGVRAVPFRLPLRRSFRWASLQVALGGFVYVRVETDEGIVGHGEATPLPDWGGDFGRRGGETQETVVAIVERVLAPALTGLDPTAIAAAHAAMDRVLRGNSYARCAVDIALHDIWGKAVGQPLYRLLGGPARGAVPVAHMIGIMPLEEAVEEAAAAAADGLTAVQIKGGEDAARDIELVRLLRERLGPKVFLRLDANQGYRRAKQALNVLAAMRAEGRDLLDMVEQPVEGAAEMAAVAAGATVPVIVDEGCWNAADALEMVRLRACDAISIYLAKAGGIEPARQVAAVAGAANLPCDVNGSMESAIGNAANLHFALAMRSVTLASVIPISAPAGQHPCAVGGHYYEDDILAEPFRVRDGALLPLEAPGLGIEVDADKLEAFRVD